MPKIQIEKQKLAEILTHNRAIHHKEYSEALAEYQHQMIEKLEGVLEKVKKDPKTEIHLNLVKPRHHVDDYDRVISMLKLHQDHTIELDDNSFRRFVEDEWDWTNHFKNVTSSYTS